jgi:hypothetical protein
MLKLICLYQKFTVENSDDCQLFTLGSIASNGIRKKKEQGFKSLWNSCINDIHTLPAKEILYDPLRILPN